MNAPKLVALKVIEQGAVRINTAYIYCEANDIVCIHVDLRSKRVESPMVGCGDNDFPTLYFTAGKHALHLDSSKPRDSMTIVELSDYLGWQIFACEGPARYTLNLVLTRHKTAV